MSLIIRLSEAKLMCPDHGFETGVRRLSADEFKMFNQLCGGIEIAQQEGKLTVVYRGEKKVTLSKKLSAKCESHDFLDRLFYFGDKARNYFGRPINDVRDRSYLKSVNDVSSETIEFIFGQLHQMTTQDFSTGSEKQKMIEQFKRNNPELVSFFSEKSNAEKFIDRLYRLKSEHKIEEVKDYYLYLLHTHNIGKTFFVSTSTSRKTAISFALRDEKIRKRSIVFHYFVPEVPSKHGVSLSSSKSTQLTCQENGLPVFTSDLYPGQDELAIKGALFPHFILGYCDLEFGYFVVNPHLFRQPENYFPSVLSSGFFIDQTQFEEKIDKTCYWGYVTRWSLSSRTVYTDKFHKKAS